MRNVRIEFQDDEQALLFKEEMKHRFKYPRTASRNEVVHGRDENGNTVFVSSLTRGVFSNALLASSQEGFFTYCFDGADGYTHEFDTLAEAKRAAKQHTKENPGFEVAIYGMSSFYYKDGKQI